MSLNDSESIENNDSADDLNEALAAGDDADVIVAEQKQPLSRSTLVMFGVLVIGAGGLFAMYKHSGPKAAGAAVTKETAEARKTISTFLSGPDAGFKTLEDRLKNTEKVVQRFAKYPSATQVPLSDLTTNPFRQHTEHAKKDNSELSEAAEKKKRDDERLAVKKAAEGLQVQSIMFGDTRKACMINNVMYREGQSFDNFTIEKISPAAVIIKNGPYRFELRMQR
jgi:hypothetical protein